MYVSYVQYSKQISHFCFNNARKSKENKYNSPEVSHWPNRFKLVSDKNVISASVYIHPRVTLIVVYVYVPLSGAGRAGARTWAIWRRWCAARRPCSKTTGTTTRPSCPSRWPRAGPPSATPRSRRCSGTTTPRWYVRLYTHTIRVQCKSKANINEK